MSRVMLLVSRSGATLARIEVHPGGDDEAEARLIKEAVYSGYSATEIKAARVVIVGDF